MNTPTPTPTFELDHVAGAVADLASAHTLAARWGLTLHEVPPTPTGLHPALGYLAVGFVELLVPVDRDVLTAAMAGATALLAAADRGGGWTAWFVHSKQIDELARRHGGSIKELPAAGKRPPLRVLPPPDQSGLLPFVISLGENRQVELERRAAQAADSGDNQGWKLIGVEVQGDRDVIDEYLGSGAATLPIEVREGPPGITAVLASGPRGRVRWGFVPTA